MRAIKRTNSEDADFIKLVHELDQELALRDGNEHDFYQQFNSIVHLDHVIIAYHNNKPLGCGAFKDFKTRAEIKRMYTHPSARSQGIAIAILESLEAWALELGYKECILETGRKQYEAVKLYQKMGYQKTGNYGQYKGVDNSLCFMKTL